MGLLDGLTLSVSVDGGDSVVVFPDGKIEKHKEDEMGCCGGGCGCQKREDAQTKNAHLESREVGKLCPVCDARYLASGPFFKKESVGPDTTHCTECGTQQVWAYRPTCHFGAVINPRDRYCRHGSHEGHRICQCEGVHCPGWHDYTDRFAEK